MTTYKEYQVNFTRIYDHKTDKDIIIRGIDAISAKNAHEKAINMFTGGVYKTVNDWINALLHQNNDAKELHLTHDECDNVHLWIITSDNTDIHYYLTAWAQN